MGMHGKMNAKSRGFILSFHSNLLLGDAEGHFNFC